MSHLSLCSGIGGLELAVGTPSSFAENDPAPAAVLAEWFPEVPNIGDWTHLDNFNDWPDLITGGLPCQPLSGAGKGLTDSDERYLFDDLVRILRSSDVRPTLMLENVRGILYPRNAVPFWRLISALANLGYVGQWEVVRASAIGAPHRRERWFCLATHPDSVTAWRHSRTAPRMQGENGGWSEPDYSLGSGYGDRDVALLATPTSWLGRRPSHSDCTEGSPALIGTGRELTRDITRLLPTPTARDHKDGVHTPNVSVNSLLGRAVWSTLSLQALHASDYGPAVRYWERLTRPAPTPTDDEGRLAVPFTEWMMGLPEGYTEPLGRTKALKAIGNAVLPAQASYAFHLLHSNQKGS